MATVDENLLLVSEFRELYERGKQLICMPDIKE
jgi:hypothetical protein